MSSQLINVIEENICTSDIKCVIVDSWVYLSFSVFEFTICEDVRDLEQDYRGLQEGVSSGGTHFLG